MLYPNLAWRVVGFCLLCLIPFTATAVMEVIETSRPGGIDVVVYDFPHGLNFYEGSVTPGQRIPEWADAFRASMYPHTFDSYEAWRSYFGNGQIEAEYMTKQMFKEASEVPIMWDLYRNDNVSVPYAFTLSKGEVKYLVAPYRYSGNVRYPETMGKSNSTALELFYQHEGSWKMLTGDQPGFMRLGLLKSGKAMIEELESGKFDDAFDFTVHYLSFPQYDPQRPAVGPTNEATKLEVASGGEEVGAGDSIDGESAVDESNRSEAEEASIAEKGKGSWLYWLLGVFIVMVIALVAFRFKGSQH